MQPLALTISILVIALAAIIALQQASRDDFELQHGNNTVTEDIMKQNEQTSPQKDGSEQGGALSTRNISVTDGVKHSVPLDEIISGGVGKDDIPPIDNPKFISVKKAEEWLKDDEPGIAFSHKGTHRFYPYQILVWHEIVNDTVEEMRILASYCPLCLTGVVFDPLVHGERVEFGTSGKLWKSNLVMYDRKTESLWSQVLGEAIAGEMTGTTLTLLPSDQLRFGEWKKQFPDGDVLSRDTGNAKFYGHSPYGDLFSVTNTALSFARPDDTRLPHDAFIFGIIVDNKAKAYHVDAIKKKGEVVDTFNGETFVLRHNKDLDVVRMFKKLPNGGEERIVPVSGFWFSWAVAHPETELHK